jgi:hypothetical protein
LRDVHADIVAGGEDRVAGMRRSLGTGFNLLLTVSRGAKPIASRSFPHRGNA